MFTHKELMLIINTLSIFIITILLSSGVSADSNLEMKTPFKIPFYRGKIEGYEKSKCKLPAFCMLYRGKYSYEPNDQEGDGRHAGIDIAVDGVDVIAPWYGKIIYANDWGAWGGLIVMECKELPGLEPGKARYFIWAHNKSWYVKKGDKITKEHFTDAITDEQGNFAKYCNKDFGDPKDIRDGHIIGGIVIATTGGGKNDPHPGHSTGRHSHFQGQFHYNASKQPYWPSWAGWQIDKKPFYSKVLENFTPANVPDDWEYYNARDDLDKIYYSEINKGLPKCSQVTNVNPDTKCYPDSKQAYEATVTPLCNVTFDPLSFIQERSNIGKFAGGGDFGVFIEPKSRIMYNDFFLFGGYEYFGVPTNNYTPWWIGYNGIRVHKAWGRLSQDFVGGKCRKTMFVWNKNQERFYPIFMGFLELYFMMNKKGYDTGSPASPERKLSGNNAEQHFEDADGNRTYTFHYDNESVCVWAEYANGERVPECEKCWDKRRRETLKVVVIYDHFENGIGGGGLSDHEADDSYFNGTMPPEAPKNLNVL